MRRISAIFCDLVSANWHMHRAETVKTEIMMIGEKMDHRLVAELDKKTREMNEKRKALFNEMDDILEILIKNRSYNWEGEQFSI